MKTALSNCIAACTLALAGVAQASPVEFTVEGSFDSGATFSGTFTLDGENRALLASDITTTADGGFTGDHYVGIGAGVPYVQGNGSDAPDDFSLLFYNEDRTALLFFWLAGTPAGFTGGAVLPLGLSCQPRNCAFSKELDIATGDSRTIAGGMVQAVPEPASGALALAAMAAALVTTRRRPSAR